VTALPEMAQGDAEIRKILDDASIGHRTAARMINNKMGGLPVTSEKSVRRYRRTKISASTLTNPQPPNAPRPKAATGGGVSWTPRIDIDPNVGGEFFTVPRLLSINTEVEREEAELLAEHNLDPAVWQVEWARKSKWQRPDGEWLEAHRVSFRRRGSGQAVSVADVDTIMSGYMTSRKVSARQDRTDRIVMVPAGDLQLGKQYGGGTAATIERFCRITDDIAEGLHRYVDQVVPPGLVLILPWLGDCIEGIVSQKGRILTTLDIPITEQVRVYRRLMMHQVAMLAPLASRVLIPVVPGNHDETIRTQEMPVHDSWAIEGASAVADWMTGRDEYRHVQFVFPELHELGITVDLDGQREPYSIAFTHGHVAASPAGIIPWWKGQAYGRQHAGRANMLVSAHFHHFRMEHTGTDRTWLQIPALDGGSPWYERKSGEHAPTGLVSVDITPGQGQGWRGLTVHS
jgi:hypothetical protein